MKKRVWAIYSISVRFMLQAENITVKLAVLVFIEHMYKKEINYITFQVPLIGMTAETFYANSCTKLINVIRAADTFNEFNSMFSLSFYVLPPMNNAKQKCYFCFFAQWLYRFTVVMLTLQDRNAVMVKT